MAGRASDSVVRQVHRLFTLGAVGTMTDAQLLDWFVARRDEAGEAAFEELTIRHGPMVFRVCRSVLHDTHDAEDAFQAAFLVLAHRAKSISRRGSVASWLFGVAHRVATGARSRAARRRARDQRVAEQNPEVYLQVEECHDWSALHEEIDRLPERLRAPLVLCYLEGLTYAAAAHQLALSEGAFRGRLARAREQLRRRLIRRGVTVPAGLLVAGTAGQAQAAIPVPLACSTIRIALGFMAGNTAAVLARGVLNSMVLNQLKVAMVLLCLGVGGSYWAWHAFAEAVGDERQASSKQVVGKTRESTPVSAPEGQPTPPAVTCRLSGTVRVEGTGEPVAGAKLQIHVGDVDDFPSPNHRIVDSGADGQFVVDLPAGPVQVVLDAPPVGYYWVTRTPGSMEMLFAGPDEPVIHREYRVRKGTIWSFQITRGVQRRPGLGFVSGRSVNELELFEAQADGAGQTYLTLPTEGRSVVLSVQESSRFSSQFRTGSLGLRLEWESSFRPDELQEISPLEGKVRRFRLIDANEKSATLQAAALIEPVNANGRLVIHVAVPDRDSKDFGALTGQVLDDRDRPIPGVLVGLATMGRRVSNELRHQSTTNAEGRYRLRDIPRQTIDGEPVTLRILAAKEGYAGYASLLLTMKEGATEKFQAVDPIRLERGVSMKGIVVDHRGRPVAGARVRSNKPGPHGELSENILTVRTDEKGRFTMRVHRGANQLITTDGKVVGRHIYLAVESSRVVCLQLPEPTPKRDAPLKSLPARSQPLRVGQAAPEWQVGPWSDAQARKLADDRGKAVVLYFWGTDFWQSVGALPALGKLATRFEPRGVVFRAIHHPDMDERRMEEQIRRLLALKEAPLIFALDQVRIERHSRGVTAQQYGVNNYPVVILIDHAGMIAFRSDAAAEDHNLAAVFMKILTDPERMTEERANRSVERAIAEEIESVLNPKE